MKLFFSLVFLLFFSTRDVNASGLLYFPNHRIENISNESVQIFLKDYFTDLQQEKISLSLLFANKTKVAQHYTYAICVHGFPILQHEIKVNTNQDGQIMSIKREGDFLDKVLQFDSTTARLTWNNVNAKQLLQLNQLDTSLPFQLTYKVVPPLDKSQLVLELNQWSKSVDNTFLFLQDGTIFQQYNNLRYANKDSVISVKVFKPDPLTIVQQPYGGVYIDNADANATWMNAAYSTENVMSTYDDVNQLFYLENQHVKIDDFEPPTIVPSSSPTPIFNFARNESGFEETNVLYHITNFHDYISSLGYDTLMDLQLLADAHGQFNSDNSVFNRNGGNPTISFGIGGVDDAEDADVIIHEYCHGVSWSANNNSAFTTERSALDEGLADYFATSYSRSISSYNWSNVFNWDGHNQFWIGRSAITSNNYPSSGNIYAIGEIWNAAMSSIWTDLGAIVTDKLMLESLHFFTNQTTLPEAALYVMQADTLLFGGANANSICQRFRNKNIFNDNCRPLVVEDISKPRLYSILNSMGFAKGESPLKIQFEKSVRAKLSIYTLQGQCVKEVHLKDEADAIFWPDDFNAGMYFMLIENGESRWIERIVKW